MTVINSSNTAVSKNDRTLPPLKVALAGLTMAQQSLLEFYFQTQEGKKQYIQVLGKDADVYITNFDKVGSTEAWDNLYANEKKPTLVLSHRHATDNNYIYIPKPITPTTLENATVSLNLLLNNKQTTPLPDSLQFSIDSQQNNTTETPSIAYEKSIPAQLVAVPTDKDIQRELEELLPFKEQNISQKQDNFSGLEILDSLSLQEEKTESIKAKSIPILEGLSEKNTLNNDTPSDDLEALLKELSEEELKQKEQPFAEDKPPESQKEKEENRWNVLCGEYDDISYKINTDKETHFKLTKTLFPYIKDTINFSKRSNCWMKISYKYLSISIDPEKKHIYSNVSLEDRNFIYLCIKDIDEDQVELEEIDEKNITLLKQDHLDKKHFNYSFDAFLWSTSLIVSHGRLPDNISPDNKISINNWLNLKEVEKFPHIMQIAAVFNQHRASLNEVATWMNLPKRYVYSFYNGVEALDMIESDSEKSNKEGLITLMKKEKESMLKKLFFTKKVKK